MGAMYTIGVDIGGTNTAFGIVDRRGKLVYKGRKSTQAYPDFVEFLRAIHQDMAATIAKIGLEHFAGIGIGAPLANYYTGMIEDSANLPWKGYLPLAAKAREVFGLKATVTNDANAAALGEMTYGIAKGIAHFVMITLGTGVGSGIVVNGQLLYGDDGLAGEIGHFIAIPNGRSCGCGRNGCLETYVSARGIARTAREWIEQGKCSDALKGITGQLNSYQLYQLALQGDSSALAIFDYTAQILADVLVNVVTVLSPKAFVFFGGLAASGDILLAPTQKYMEEKLLYAYKGKIQILSSTLADADAAILGASALAWQ